MKFSIVNTDPQSILRYVELFSVCFPNTKKFTIEYLLWLYKSNPDGTAIGFDAWDGDFLAAHYVVIPSAARIFGASVPVVLSLNTATHPKYQGKGLFTQLAELTYAEAARMGFCGVYGVANSNSTPGFVRKLGFTLIDKLDAKVGIGSIMNSNTAAMLDVQFELIRSVENISWRCSNPNNRIFRRLNDGKCEFLTSTFNNILTVRAEIFSKNAPELNCDEDKLFSPFNLFLGFIPTRLLSKNIYLNIPDRLKPSPLNLIYKPIGKDDRIFKSGAIVFNFLDFDAY
jgi:GNAT superfamily N-acetyltransferase